MRLTYTAIRFPPARGGVERYVESMADVMAPRHAVRVITSDYSQHLRGSRSILADGWAEHDRRRPYEVRRFRHRTVSGLGAYPFSLAAGLAIASENPDVIHAHCYYYSSCDFAALASVVTQTPFVVSPSLPSRDGAKWRGHRRAMAWMFRWARVTTVLSEFERLALMRAGFEPRRIVVVPPTVEALNPTASDIIDLPWAEKSRLILAVGRVSYEKGIDTLIAALPTILRRVPEARLVIAGPFVFPDVQKLKEQLRALRLERFVTFASDLTDNELAGLYRRAEVVAFPSRYEAFGIVAIEAMAYGTPVVVSDAGSLPEVVCSGEFGLIHRVGDAKSLAEAVAKVMLNDDVADALKAAGSDHVQARHSRESQKAILEQVYADAVEPRGGPRSGSRGDG